MTYSVVAVDPDSGEVGAAVQSCYPAVGAVVPWIAPGAGAVATQAAGERRYGIEGLARLRGGEAPEDALAEMLRKDTAPQLRQVAIIDTSGRSSAHTGTRCIAAAGHVTAEGVSIQANIVTGPEVWEAMLETYTNSRGDLAGRLLATLAAGEAAGGDLRGQQSAALVVAPLTGEAWERIVDVRVDDHPDPLTELTRLTRIQAAYQHLSTADRLASTDPTRAYEACREALALAPGDPQILMYAVALAAAAGDLPAAHQHATAPQLQGGNWVEVLNRFEAAGLAPRGAGHARALLTAGGVGESWVPDPRAAGLNV